LFVDEVEQPLRLQGQYFDGETGLYYNRFRYYEPTIGCFVSQDPLGLAAGENVYAYAPSTQKWIDPLGLCKVNKSEISDENFVRFDPVKVRDSITKSGIQTKFFADKKVWFTKYKYVKDVTNPSDLETMLYRKNLQQYSTGKFSSGADLYRLKNISDAVPAGKTNMTNGIPQWRITRDIPASDIEMIKTLD
jgi:RHS repeat-associated protein